MPSRAGGHTAEDVAAADDDADFDAEALNLGDVGGDARGHGGVDAEGLLAHQRLPGQLQQDALVHGRRRRRHTGIIVDSRQSIVGSLSQQSAVQSAV